MVSANSYDGDFADITRLPSSFKIWLNGKAVKPTVHARVYMSPIGADKENPVDVTAEFRACGISKRELQYPWIEGVNFEHIAQKLWICDNAKLATMIDKSPLDKDDGLHTRIAWDTQLIYSWQQKFVAGAVTRIKHSYQPLVGSSVYFSQDEYDATVWRTMSGGCLRVSRMSKNPSGLSLSPIF